MAEAERQQATLNRSHVQESQWDHLHCSSHQAHEAETQSPAHPRVEAEGGQARTEDALAICRQGYQGLDRVEGHAQKGGGLGRLQPGLLEIQA